MQRFVTDQAGVQRTSSVDGLGRVAQVVENGISATTGYTYDALDDLISVSQSGLNRSFSYTSLGRLASATNPESGTVSYLYDANGNLTQKTDNRLAVTSYTYNGLNQLLTKTYTIPTSTPPNTAVATPPVTYTYGSNVSIPNDNNANYPVGRLTQVSNSISTNTYRYDALGRTESSMQTMSGVNYPFLYSWYPVGMSSETYPSTRTVTTGYDGAGRPNLVTGFLSGTSAANYAQNVSYAPHGAVQQLLMGDGVTETSVFNPRLEPCQIQAGSPVTTPSCTAAVQAGNLLAIVYGYASSTDNGNVLRQTITRPNDSGVQQTWTQSYGYDLVNRLTSAGEAGSGTVWTQGYQYDVFGNRAATSSFPQNLSTPTCVVRVPARPSARALSPQSSAAGMSHRGCRECFPIAFRNPRRRPDRREP